MTGQEMADVLNALGGPASKVMEIAVHGVIVEGWMLVAISTLMIAPAVACWRWRDAVRKMDAGDLLFPLSTLLAFLGSILLIFAMSNFLAPDAAAINSLLRAASGR